MNLSFNGKSARRSARSGGLPARRSLGEGGGSRRNLKSTAGKPSFLDRSLTRGNCFRYNSAVMNEDSITELKQNLRGTLIQPGDADYDEARKVYNGMIHKKPRLIARCADVADVIRLVNFARDNDLLVSIRGGGTRQRRKSTEQSRATGDSQKIAPRPGSVWVRHCGVASDGRLTVNQSQFQ